jgi:hypothetical protein
MFPTTSIDRKKKPEFSDTWAVQPNRGGGRIEFEGALVSAIP